VFLENESLDQQDMRFAFAEALYQGERTAQTQTLARAAARAVLRDAGQDRHPMLPKEFRRLVDFSGDGSLRTDMPPFPSPDTALNRRVKETLRFEFGITDCGATVIADAAMLNDGRLLVALGEAGVKLLTRDGRTVKHFDQPAHRLVLSDHGDRAIALARRGEAWRLARLDLLRQRVDDWCEAQLQAFAADYDGDIWFVGAKGDFYAIDATARNFDALWRVPEPGDQIAGVVRSHSTCQFLTEGWGTLEKWEYQLPLLRLRNRIQVPLVNGAAQGVELHAACSAAGLLVDQSRYAQVSKSTAGEFETFNCLPVLQLRVFAGDMVQQEITIGDGNSRPGQPEVRGQIAVSPVYEEAGAIIRVCDLHDGLVTAEFMMVNAQQVSTRVQEQRLTIADDCGRLIVFDLSRNCLIRNLRV
jgi:hypothetical protein